VFFKAPSCQGTLRSQGALLVKWDRRMLCQFDPYAAARGLNRVYDEWGGKKKASGVFATCPSSWTPFGAKAGRELERGQIMPKSV